MPGITGQCVHITGTLRSPVMLNLFPLKEFCTFELELSNQAPLQAPTQCEIQFLSFSCNCLELLLMTACNLPTDAPGS